MSFSNFAPSMTSGLGQAVATRARDLDSDSRLQELPDRIQGK